MSLDYDIHVSWELKAVFLCKKYESDGPEEAMLKILILAPSDPYESPEDREWEVNGEPASKFGKQEEDALRTLTQHRCSSTPHFIAAKREIQDGNMLMPGGYIHYILMTKVDGVRFDSVQHFSDEQIHAMQEAFTEAWFESSACQVVPHDERLHNLLWDMGTLKCYIVDYE
ncbi:hypothetical protein D8B26_005002 [Coccidioides posadasii str. Silveira]|uniref:uncharacterized protein n=1 Tax=Coccidioides posadasii (strain RMSCC 757 / Silveira) TaxID=443226 RepID=UPI001BEED1AD|nr:hypothetical protein D8B26_005002 [Coccidioides posadasii str. Silveira]